MVKKRTVVDGAMVKKKSAHRAIVKKRKAADDLGDDDAPRVNKRVRNRASPLSVVTLNDTMTNDQKAAVVKMEFGSLLDIKCHHLHYPVIKWFAGTYDKHSRQFVISGRGRIPLDGNSVYRTLGVPHGSEPVVYALDRDIEARLAPVLFLLDGSTPLTTRVFEILKAMKLGDEAFKQVWLMFVTQTILAPTTNNHVSNRCYPLIANIGNVHNFNWCQFIADRLHEELSVGKFTHECLFHLQLLYVDSLDVSGLGLNLPDGRFAVNVWSKDDIDAVLLCDLQIDGKSYGKLELKREFGLNFALFGGADGFSKWFDTCCDPSCTDEDKAEVSNLIAPFASGIAGLMGSLVGGWTKLHGKVRAEMANQFGAVAQTFLSGGASSSGPPPSAPAPRATRASTSGMKGGHGTVHDDTELLPDDTEFLPDDSETDHDSSDGASSDDDLTNQYIRAPRKGKGIQGGKSVRGDELIISQTEGGQSFFGDEHVDSQGDVGQSFGGDERVGYQDDGGQFVCRDENIASKDDGHQAIAVDDTVVHHKEGSQSGGADHPIAPHEEARQSVGGDDPAASHKHDSPVDHVVTNNEGSQSVGIDDAVGADVTPATHSVPMVSSELLPSQIPLTAAARVAVEESVVSEESAPSNGINSQAQARVISANLVSSLNEGTKVGSKVPAATNVAESNALRVYKAAGKRKRKLQTVRTKDLLIRGIVAEELGMTAEMISSASKMHKGLQVAKKASPKRNVTCKRDLVKKQATRSSPRLAKLRYAVCRTSLGATTSVIDLDPCSPGASPSRVQGVEASEPINVDCHDAAANIAVDARPVSLTSSQLQGSHSLETRHVPAILPVSKTDVILQPSVEPSVCVKGSVGPQTVPVDECVAHLVSNKGAASAVDLGPSVCVNVSDPPVSTKVASISTDAIRTSATKMDDTLQSGVWTDVEGNVYVPARTLFADLAPDTSVNEDVSVEIDEEHYENAAHVDDDEAIKSKPDDAVSVPARTLLTDPVPETSCKIQDGHEDVQVEGYEKPSHVEDDEPIKNKPDDGVSVPARKFFYDISPPMWNFSSQSPEAVPDAAVSSFHVDDPVRTSDHPQTTAITMVVPPTASNHGASGTANIPEAIPTAGRATGTSSTNEPPVGDYFHIFESDEVVPLSWAGPDVNTPIVISTAPLFGAVHTDDANEAGDGAK